MSSARRSIRDGPPDSKIGDFGARITSKLPIYREAQIRLRNYIRARGLKVGDRLPSEASLSAELGVSKPSLREATRSLQTLGIIEARHGSGLFVAEFSLRPVIELLPYGLANPGPGLNEILVAREAMEVGLMPAVCRSASGADLDVCEQLQRRMAHLEEAGEPTTEVDKKFHLQLYKSLNNPLVDNLIELFWEIFDRVGAELPDPPSPAQAEIHLRIIEALRLGDVNASIQAMQGHFNDVRVRISKVTSDADENNEV